MKQLKHVNFSELSRTAQATAIHRFQIDWKNAHEVHVPYDVVSVILDTYGSVFTLKGNVGAN